MNIYITFSIFKVICKVTFFKNFATIIFVIFYINFTIYNNLIVKTFKLKAT